MKEQTFHDEDSLNPKQWRSLTDHQRYLLIDRLFVVHQRLLPVCEAFEQTAKRAEDAEAKTPCAIALLGDTGVGKTAVAQRWMSSAKARHTAFQGEEHIHYQYISASPGATQKAFLAQWLAVCSDPN